ncbi:unnamed protein product [Brachionus calyciflorus]|uniref:Chitin-binding type-2 domain-containing protein n=1 Tax=Brachionus calyciflorus TaxID=104777 RepID=A0A814H172_9BILA|nr:unnamed protein product [Brachionus calyciflorus]
MKFFMILNISLFIIKIDSLTIQGSFCYGCNLAGSDINEIPNISIDDCLSECIKEISCTYFSFLKSNNNCWLKNKPDVNFSQFSNDGNFISGIVERSIRCSNTQDFTPNPLNCSLYYRCFSGFLQLMGCLNGMYFDPFRKTCSIDSTCSYVCKNNQEVTGIFYNNNEYYNCVSGKIEKCKNGGKFDIANQKCSKNIFQIKYTSGNFGLIESANIRSKVMSCLAWCMEDIRCKMVSFKYHSCQKFDLINNNFFLNISLVYFKLF